jgi:hypothetical protein
MADLEYFFKKRFNEAGMIGDPFVDGKKEDQEKEPVLQRILKKRGRPRKQPIISVESVKPIKRSYYEDDSDLGIEHNIPIPSDSLSGRRIGIPRKRAIIMKPGDSVLCKTLNEAKALKVALFRENKGGIWWKNKDGTYRVWAVNKKQYKKVTNGQS